MRTRRTSGAPTALGRHDHRGCLIVHDLVTAACDAGGLVYPFPWKDGRAEQFAMQQGAALAGRRGSGSRFSLSPNTLRGLSPGETVVLPSPNGSQLGTETGTLPTIAACLRNASAAAAKAKEFGQRISIIAAGERWLSSEMLRPALEDLLGAGAVIAALTGTASPASTGCGNALSSNPSADSGRASYLCIRSGAYRDGIWR